MWNHGQKGANMEPQIMPKPINNQCRKLCWKKKRWGIVKTHVFLTCKNTRIDRKGHQKQRLRPMGVRTGRASKKHEHWRQNPAQSRPKIFAEKVMRKWCKNNAQNELKWEPTSVQKLQKLQNTWVQKVKRKTDSEIWVPCALLWLSLGVLGWSLGLPRGAFGGPCGSLVDPWC